jgi:flagellar hook-basal body complex protein FliE
MENLKNQTEAWLDFVKKAPTASLASNELFLGETQSPVDSSASGTYSALAKAAETPGLAPKSIYDGLQTTINLCRVRANYNALDPQGNGNRAHFVAFTQNIADVPFISLFKSKTTEIKQKSQNADELINSFVAGFDGLKNNDIDAMKKSVKSLVSAALSYSEQNQVLSDFAQNLLQNDADGSVTFYLYSSTFKISSVNKKGTISFQSEYSLTQAHYNLSVSSWNEVRDAFEKERKTTTEEWLKKMKTPPKEGSQVSTICLEDKISAEL